MPYPISDQFLVVLLYALKPLVHGATKEQVCARVEDNGWLELIDDDWTPYPGASNHEPRWMNNLAWARQRAVDDGFMENTERNNWRITEKGKSTLEKIEDRAMKKEIDVSECFFWSYSFKALMDDTFAVRNQRPRPTVVYDEDWQRMYGGMR